MTTPTSPRLVVGYVALALTWSWAAVGAAWISGAVEHVPHRSEPSTTVSP